MAAIKATDNTLDQIIRNNKVVLVDFWAPWCGPCRMMAPVLDQLAAEADKEAVIVKVNVDENPVSAIKHHIQGIPTLKLFVNGKETTTFVGVQPLNKLKALIMQYAN
ncbi:thioredoxin [Cohnella laeviribosi]|jgi:thioredoxin 1|uniref:Thioredoxin n=2 Tax=Brevibacillus composti TaxID=2796470 RepID=A0A7T5EK74_9BACL|nr:thioredoxin [Cohnella laeviribosi]QQE74155.1 thioredoxin [Brevibacillus composti]QUO43780.1 thioredoxin [Brevibacillus composti]